MQCRWHNQKYDRYLTTSNRNSHSTLIIIVRSSSNLLTYLNFFFLPLYGCKNAKRESSLLQTEFLPSPIVYYYNHSNSNHWIIRRRRCSFVSKKFSKCLFLFFRVGLRKYSSNKVFSLRDQFSCGCSSCLEVEIMHLIARTDSPDRLTEIESL